MLRPVTIAALAAIGVLMMTPRVSGGVLTPQITSVDAWKQVVATGGSGGDVYATAYHGYIEGNDAKKAGEPLLGYLNSGTNGKFLTLQPDGQQFTITNRGMFGSTERQGLRGPGSIIDVVSFQTGYTGFNHPTQEWLYVGKSDDRASSPFKVATGGLLTLKAAHQAAGSYVLSLKAGNQYSVYLFQHVDAISSFKYSITKNLSHASLYRVGPGGGVDPLGGVVPEPASLAVFGLGALLGIGGSVRRRFTTRKGLALRGLAI